MRAVQKEEEVKEKDKKIKSSEVFLVFPSLCLSTNSDTLRKSLRQNTLQTYRSKELFPCTSSGLHL